jgi:hypothetical protein
MAPGVSPSPKYQHVAMSYCSISSICYYILKNKDTVVPHSSAYGLAKHRDGCWEWVMAPGVSPSPKYQHVAMSYCSISSICYYILKNKDIVVHV